MNQELQIQPERSRFAWLRNLTTKEKLLYGVMAAAIIGAVSWRLAPLRHHFNPFGSKVVVFDVIRYANAERAVAASMLKGSGAAADAVIMLRDANTRTLAVIQEVAGEDAVVVARQSVISAPNVHDITEEVLKRLGLPTEVATAMPALISDPVSGVVTAPEGIVNGLRQGLYDVSHSKSATGPAPAQNDASKEVMP